MIGIEMNPVDVPIDDPELARSLRRTRALVAALGLPENPTSLKARVDHILLHFESFPPAVRMGMAEWAAAALITMSADLAVEAGVTLDVVEDPPIDGGEVSS